MNGYSEEIHHNLQRHLLFLIIICSEYLLDVKANNSMRVLTFICGLLFMSMFLVTKSERILNKQLSLTQIIKKKKKKKLQLWQTIFGFHVPFSNKTNWSWYIFVNETTYIAWNFSFSSYASQLKKTSICLNVEYFEKDFLWSKLFMVR